MLVIRQGKVLQACLFLAATKVYFWITTTVLGPWIVPGLMFSCIFFLCICLLVAVSISFLIMTLVRSVAVIRCKHSTMCKDKNDKKKNAKGNVIPCFFHLGLTFLNLCGILAADTVNPRSILCCIRKCHFWRHCLKMTNWQSCILSVFLFFGNPKWPCLNLIWVKKKPTPLPSHLETFIQWQQTWKEREKAWEQSGPSPRRDMCRGSVCLYMCVLECVLSHGWAGQADRNRLQGGPGGGARAPQTEHAHKITGRDCVVVSGHILEL